MKKINLGMLFFTLLKINTVTFGGGYTIVPVIRDEFSRKKQYIDDDEMMRLIAIAQSVPGAMAVNTSILIGYRLAGVVGAIVATLAAALPCFLIITIISYFYRAFRQNFYVNAALTGMSGMISAILMVTVWDFFKLAIKKDKVMSVLLILSGFSASYFFNVPTALIILYFALTGIVVTTAERTVRR